MLGFKLSSHRHAKIVWKTCVEHHSFFRLAHNASSSTSTSASKSTSKLSKNYFSSRDSVPIDRHEQSRKQFTKAAKIHNTIAENRLNEKVSSANGANGSSNGNNGKLSLLSITKSYKTYDNKVTSKQMETIPRMAWEQQVYVPKQHWTCLEFYLNLFLTFTFQATRYSSPTTNWSRRSAQCIPFEYQKCDNSVDASG